MPIGFSDRLVPLFTNGPAPCAISDRVAVQRDRANAQCSWPLWGLETCMIDHLFDTRKYIRIGNQMPKNINPYKFPVTYVCKICGKYLTWIKTLLSAWSQDNCRSSWASLLPVQASLSLFMIRISLKFVTRSPIDNKPALVQVTAWRRIGDKPLLESMWTRFTDAYMQH